ncbi:MAG: DUF87 domain-containing protein [Leptospiraceae bacterium]|nr:DUF87 domain-containing protein [Leptospiraceae bacterium]
MELDLFPKDKVVGIFRGFQPGGLEFHADLVLPYRNEFQNIPMHGQFLLVQLETTDEAVLGRITSFSSEGKLTYGTGEEFNLRAMREDQPIPEDLREQYLKYKVNIRVLGVLRKKNGELLFVPSHRRLPHMGSKVAFLSDEVLREVAGYNKVAGHNNTEVATIGHLAFGEYVYAPREQYAPEDDNKSKDWIQFQQPAVEIRFPVKHLVSRRSFIFARAGFGKSNLNKLLFSTFYKETPLIQKRGGKKVPVGTIIFDPEGEYFWPDDKGRPGLCDVPHLQDKLVVFTDRKAPSEFYQSFVAGGVKLDIRRLNPADVISIALDREKQGHQNIHKLRSLSEDSWKKLVDLIHEKGLSASDEIIGHLIGFGDKSSGRNVEIVAARSNMFNIVNMLHDPSSLLLDLLFSALSEGKLCIVDFSRMRGMQGMVLAGLILRRIFTHNQEEFTKAEPKTIPTIAVIEEAQSVLQENVSAAEPYIAWVKEGRKYDLGALLITQQPGSIPVEILSQGDNWFVFHLLAAQDLLNLQKANAHFSDDILSSLLNEPIPGQGVFWSSVGEKTYPVSFRALAFEKEYKTLDSTYTGMAADTYAQKLKIKIIENRALEEFKTVLQREDSKLPLLSQKKIPTSTIKEFFQKFLSNYLHHHDNYDTFLKNLVKKALNEFFGEKGKDWGIKEDSVEGKSIPYIVLVTDKWKSKLS